MNSNNYFKRSWWSVPLKLLPDNRSWTGATSYQLQGWKDSLILIGLDKEVNAQYYSGSMGVDMKIGIRVMVHTFNVIEPEHTLLKWMKSVDKHQFNNYSKGSAPASRKVFLQLHWSKWRLRRMLAFTYVHYKFTDVAMIDSCMIFVYDKCIY